MWDDSEDFDNDVDPEKLHEMMISVDDARNTVDLGDRYAIEPAFVEYTREPLKGGRLGDEFSYASDTNHEWLDGPGLMRMLEEDKPKERRRAGRGRGL